MKQGRFIVFEGIDGAGKTTQIDLLEQHLRRQGKAVWRTAEPTDSVTGGLLRDALCGALPASGRRCSRSTDYITTSIRLSALKKCCATAET